MEPILYAQNLDGVVIRIIRTDHHVNVLPVTLMVIPPIIVWIKIVILDYIELTTIIPVSCRVYMNIGCIGMIATLMIIIGARVCSFAEIGIVPLSCGCAWIVEIGFESIYARTVPLSFYYRAPSISKATERKKQSDLGTDLSQKILGEGPNLQTTPNQ